MAQDEGEEEVKRGDGLLVAEPPPLTPPRTKARVRLVYRSPWGKAMQWHTQSPFTPSCSASPRVGTVMVLLWVVR